MSWIAVTIKNYSRQMRQLYAYIANKFTRRLIEDRMSMGLTKMHTARGFSVLYHVFTQKQCILYSAICVIKVTLHYLMLHHFESHSALELSHTDLLGCRLTSSRGCSLAVVFFKINACTIFFQLQGALGYNIYAPQTFQHGFSNLTNWKLSQNTQL